jgi:hypothetical protein
MDHAYILEIYPPGQTETPLTVCGSDMPFLSIHRGDLLHVGGHDLQHWRAGDPLHPCDRSRSLVFGGTPSETGNSEP